MFSPMMEIWEDRASATVRDGSFAHFSARNASISAALVFSACSATSDTQFWNFSFLATKSVSAFTSTTTAFFSSAVTLVITIPSAAIRLAFFCAVARPFSRRNSTALSISPASPFSLRNSTALSMSPSVAARAFLQSIIPAPVISRNSFTIAAVTAILNPSVYINSGTRSYTRAEHAFMRKTAACSWSFGFSF